MKEGQGDKSEFRVLSLDGGGICGAFVAGFLAEIEQRTGRPFGEHFDLIAGTSTGGIIAAALAFREPASRIEQFYREHGPLIFRRWWTKPTRRWRAPLRWAGRRFAWCADSLVLRKLGLDYDWLRRSKYGADELREALVEVFGERQLGESQSRLVIPSINLTNGQTKVFKTPHLPNLYIDRHLPVVDVVLATAAAPTYFPHVVIQPGSAYVDGGLWANNPVMVAIAESIAISGRCRREGVDPVFDLETTSVLSIGTGRAAMFANPPDHKAGLGWWASRLFGLTLLTQSQGATFQGKYVLADRFERIDFDIPDSTWTIDSVCYVDQMIHNGRQRAAELLDGVRGRFLAYEAALYRPFPAE